MTISSIFVNFVIKSKKEAEDFVNAIDKFLDYNTEKKFINYDELKEIKTIFAKSNSGRVY